MSNTHVLSRALAVTAASCLVAGILAAAPAFAADSSASPSAAAVVVDNDKGGAGQGGAGPSAAPALLAAGPQISRSEVINRAASWVGLGLEYTHTGQTYQGYRKDCSGYASMAWKLSTYMGGLDTTSFVPNGVASWIGKEDLKPGDALLNDAAGSSGHIALFAGWADSSHSSYDAYEFTGSGVHHRTIPYPYFSGYGTFKPVRNNGIVDDSGDQPVAGNWDGGPAGNVGVFRPSTGQFHLRFDWGQPR
ncbi:hypothetical protein [Streptomyces sp. NRRL WC-3742]|uniref:hypothetical protein n=1 Tax=Streptomyces sp. NRRL WC-3742 TaxID=1463934 RepID=UPI00068E3F6F|nr:hypothetical protein [Streptomyces sp. NRRL WC-3742]